MVPKKATRPHSMVNSCQVISKVEFDLTYLICDLLMLLSPLVQFNMKQKKCGNVGVKSYEY